MGLTMTPDRLRESAAFWRACAANHRKQVEAEERRNDSYARNPEWPELKAMLLEQADEYDRIAAKAEAEATRE